MTLTTKQLVDHLQFLEWQYRHAMNAAEGLSLRRRHQEGDERAVTDEDIQAHENDMETLERRMARCRRLIDHARATERSRTTSRRM